jgi:hypothetical protein
MAVETKRSYDATTLLASTTTVAGALNVQGDSVRLPGMVNALMFTLDVTAAAKDNGDTLAVTVQTKLDGVNWTDVCAFASVLGDGGAVRHIEKIAASPAFAGFEVGTALTAGTVRDLLGDDWRVSYVQVDGDSDATFTFSVVACPM